MKLVCVVDSQGVETCFNPANIIALRQQKSDSGDQTLVLTQHETFHSTLVNEELSSFRTRVNGALSGSTPH